MSSEISPARKEADTRKLLLLEPRGSAGPRPRSPSTRRSSPSRWRA